MTRHHFALAMSATLTAIALTITPVWAQKAQLSKADQAALKGMAASSIAEIATGKLALQTSQNVEVQGFAQMRVDDHGKALAETQALASAKDVALPSAPDAKHQAAMVKLQALKGEAFDREYVKQAGVADHEASQALLKKIQSGAKDADLKALAGKTLPVVQTHLQHAKDLAKMKM